MTTTKQQVDSALEIMMAIAEAIKDLGSVPSGHLYARVMGHVDIHTYNTIIALLKDAKIVAEHNHLLTYIGPQKES
jgi:hypothetical protein